MTDALRVQYRVMLVGDWPSPGQHEIVQRSGVSS